MKHTRPPKAGFYNIFINLQKHISHEKNMYDVTRLATLYFPDSTERNARRRLFKVLRAERDLWARLTALHFGVWQRSFTPRQYEMVIDILGKPEETDDDFREWPHE